VDSCGAACTDTVDITVSINASPICDFPNDTTYIVCGDTTFFFLILATDVDGNLDSCVKSSGVGSFVDGVLWSFTATEAGIYSAAFVCTDSCEASCSGTVTITVVDTCVGTVTDIDGNVYQTVKIGSQWWMAENLKVTHYRNGDPIPNVTDAGTWANITTGAYCNYNNNPLNADTYGRLYNWYVVSDARIIAPEGWHVPSDGEWTQLNDFLAFNIGGKLKETGYEHWDPPNDGATNESGFTALGAGYRHYSSGGYLSIHRSTYFWSTYNQHYLYTLVRGLSCGHTMLTREQVNKHHGFSLRCIKD
jgi:uncharacterized protein (TIGR02145 family)